MKESYAKIRRDKIDSIKGRANWFYWIVLLTIADILLMEFHIGLGFQSVLAFVATLYTFSMGANLWLNISCYLMIISMLTLFGTLGYFAGKMKKWAFVLGWFLYFADGILFVINRSYIPVFIHLFVLFCLYDGLQSIKELKQMDETFKLQNYLNEEARNE